MLNYNSGNPNQNLDNYKDRLTKFSSEFELGVFLFIAKKSLLWIILFFGIAVTTAFLYLRYAANIYQARTVLQLVNDNNASRILEVNSGNENQNQIAEALELIKSPAFLKRVISKIDLSVGYFNEGSFKNNELYNSSPVLIVTKIKNNSLFNKKIYVHHETSDKGEIEYQSNGNTVKLKFKKEQLAINDDLEILVYNNPRISQSDYQTAIKAIQRPFFINYSEDWLISSLQSKLDIKIVNELAGTIAITFNDLNPDKAADVVNVMGDEFILFERENKRASSQSVINFINDQLNMISDTLRNSENDIVDYSKKKIGRAHV